MGNGYRNILILLTAAAALYCAYNLLTVSPLRRPAEGAAFRHAVVQPMSRDILVIPEPVKRIADPNEMSRNSFSFDATRQVFPGRPGDIEKEAVQSLLVRNLAGAPSLLRLRASWTRGMTGTEALSFVNNDDTCSVEHSPDQILAYEGTIELLVKIDAFRPYSGLVHKGESPDWRDESYALIFQESPDKGLLFSMVNDAGEIQYLTSQVPVAEGRWYHIAVTWDLEKVSMFINGKKVNEKVNTIGTMKSSNGSLQIGSQLPTPVNTELGTLAINGTIDEFALYRRSLEDKELSLRHAEFFGQPAGRVEAGISPHLFFIIGGAGIAALFFRSRKKTGHDSLGRMSGIIFGKRS